MAWYEIPLVGFVITLGVVATFFIFAFGVKVGIRIEKGRRREKREVQESVDKYVHSQRG